MIAPSRRKVRVWLLVGGRGRALEEVTVVMVKGCAAVLNSARRQLEDVGEVQHDTEGIDDTTNHYASVVVKGDTAGDPTIPCPTHLIAPSQDAADDAMDRAVYEKSVLEWKERQVGRVEAGRNATAPALDQTVAAGAVVLLASVLVLLKAQRDNAPARKRSTNAQDARVLFLAKEVGIRREQQPHPLYCFPALPLLLLLLLLLCRSLLSAQQALKALASMSAARAAAVASAATDRAAGMAKKVVAAFVAAAAPKAVAPHDNVVFALVVAAAPQIPESLEPSWLSVAAEERDGWAGCPEVDVLEHESCSSMGEANNAGVGKRIARRRRRTTRKRSMRKRNRNGRKGGRGRRVSRRRRTRGLGAGAARSDADEVSNVEYRLPSLTNHFRKSTSELLWWHQLFMEERRLKCTMHLISENRG